MAGETKRQALGASPCMCVRYVGVEKREREREAEGEKTTDSEQIGSVCLSQEKLNGGR